MGGNRESTNWDRASSTRRERAGARRADIVEIPKLSLRFGLYRFHRLGIRARRVSVGYSVDRVMSSRVCWLRVFQILGNHTEQFNFPHITLDGGKVGDELSVFNCERLKGH